MNRNKEGETGRSECEVTMTRYLEAEELGEIWGPGLEKQFSNQIGSCGVYNPHFSPLKISTDQSASSFLEHSSGPSSCFSLLFLSPGFHTVPSRSA